MNENLISYSGTTLLQFDLKKARDLALKKAKRAAKGEKVDLEKVFGSVALKKTNCLTLRPRSTETVSDHELAVIEKQVGNVFFKRFFQIHKDAPKVPRSLRKESKVEPEVETEEKPKKSRSPKALTVKLNKEQSDKGAV